ncbi:hypothetical protein PTKIN_Ptkin19aG0094400 [Pterospermum kingtungense]
MEPSKNTAALWMICECLEDKLIWKGSPSGFYSSKFFCRDHLSLGHSPTLPWAKIWSCSLPPKVETFCWQLLHGKIAVKVNLANRNALFGSNVCCTFCGREPETVCHLFFHCTPSWCIWTLWCRIWGLQWSVGNNGWVIFQDWLQLLPKKRCNKLWRMLFGATIWSIWLKRNDMIFKGGSLDIHNIIDLIKFRIGVWAKAKWPHVNVSISDFLLVPNAITICSNQNKERARSTWCHPDFGTLKFNVDGSSLGKPGPAGIGGILRNHLGEVLIRFSKSISIADSNEAEVLAIREALIQFVTSRWAQDFSLTIESDSAPAVAWISKPDEAPWRLRNFICHILNIKSKIRHLKVVHILREGNNLADSLAKQGVHRAVDFIEITGP